MQHFYSYFLAVLFFLSWARPAAAQNPVLIGNAAEVVAAYQQKALAKARNAGGEAVKIRHTVPGQGDLLLTLNGSRKSGKAETFFGHVNNSRNTFRLTDSAGTLSGEILLAERKKAYKYVSGRGGKAYLEEVDINKVICVGYGAATTGATPPGSGSTTAPATAAVPDLQSLPGATGVVLLDFDGQYVVSSFWNGGLPINAAPSPMTGADIREVWKLMTEDFRPFALNITTNESVFFNAPPGQRVRIIFTPTSGFFPGAGGVARLFSFAWTAEDIPCWVFIGTPKHAAEAGSHEAGHTLGLYHDGSSTEGEYYFGQAAWAPIMGTGYYASSVQWSKGEYPNANNREDDLYKIAFEGAAVGYRPDDHGNLNGAATPIARNAAGEIDPARSRGIITTPGDVDVFSFAATGGNVRIAVNPIASYANLDVLLKLVNAAGQTVLVADPSTRGAGIDQVLPAGTYYLHVDGGRGSYGADSDYGSLGEYSISGTIAPANKPPVAALTAPANGAAFTAPASIALSAAASDPDGTVSKVEFFSGATRLGEDLTSPYGFTWNSPAAGTHQLTARATDSKGGTGTSASVSITVNATAVACTASGTIRREYWAGVPGTYVSAIPVTTTPTTVSQLTAFEAPINAADNYGQRIRGYLCVPATGNYTFYLAADDRAELWLGTNDSPATRRKIASVTAWTGSRQWTKYAAQRSVAVALQANTRYYIEALHKEGTGGDNLAVGWTTPGAAVIAVIPGSVLSPFGVTAANRAPVLAGIGSKTVTLGGTVSFTATATDADVPAQTLTYSLLNAPAGAAIGSATGAFTWKPGAAGTYALTVRVTDNAPVPAFDEEKITVTVNPPPAAGVAFRVNAGGNAFATADARSFGADAYFAGGAVSAATTLGIAGTADDYLYQTGRHGAFSYNVPTGNGSYDVVLHFAETYFGNAAPGGAGSRKFHVNLEGLRKLTDYDIFAKAGGALRVAQETFRVTVSDGTLNVAFLKGTAGDPAVKAIEVLPAGSALAINAGGTAFTTAGGKRFAADVYYGGGTVSALTSGDILNTTNDALYHNARTGTAFSYGLPSGNGTFDVVLHFAETYWGSRAGGGIGSRKFNVDAEGTRRLTDYDIFARAGGAMRAVTATVRVTVSDGVLNLFFGKGSADNPAVAAVEVVPVTTAARVAAEEPAGGNWQVDLYPNPVTDKLTISLPFPASRVKATAVTDAAGMIRLNNLHRASGPDQLEVNVEKLPGGLYFLRIDTANGYRTGKFVKQ